MEYWFNVGGDVFPPEWKHPVTGMVWSGGKVYGTYFTGDPAWIYAIQWLPASPMLSYLVRDPAFARKSYENMMQRLRGPRAGRGRQKAEGRQRRTKRRRRRSRASARPSGSVMLGYVLMYDPAWAAEQLDTLWNEPGDKIAHDASEMAIMYYLAHSMRSLGRVDWTCHGSSPTSMVYVNDHDQGTNLRRLESAARSRRPWASTRATKPIGHLVAAPQILTSVNALTN